MRSLGVCSLLLSRPRNTRNDAKLNCALLCFACLAGIKVVASPGFAPAYARSYGGQARSSILNWSLVFGIWVFRKVVAREGIAPPTSLCRRDMILFHHRAGIGCGRRIRTINCAFKERRVARYSIPQ